MANRIKTVSQYDGSNWVNETPIGADASNIDVVTAGSTSRNLQDVLGTPPASGNITNNINSKVSTSGGDIADTIISKDITNYDSSTEVDDDILTDTAAVMSTNTSTLWSRFNLFRKKVSNNFENYFTNSSLVGSDPGITITGDDSTAYTTAAINNYLSNVIGYTSASAPSAGTVASQLSTLNSNFNQLFNNSIVFGHYYQLDVDVANGITMSITGGGARFYPFNFGMTGHGLLGVYVGVRTTQARTNLPSIRLCLTLDGAAYKFILNMPYVLWASSNIQGGAHYASSAGSLDYFTYGPTHAANTTITWFGFTEAYMTSA